MRSFQARNVPSRGVAVLAGLCLVLGLACARFTPLNFARHTPGSVDGRVLAAAEDASWVVVYLAADGAEAAPADAPAARLQRDESGFAPPFLAVAQGQPVELASGDGIHHRFFSYSEPNQFDLGLVADGAAERIAFAHPGLVHVYCSLHAGERASIFVAPSPWFAALPTPGPFALEDIPPGHYALHAWSQRRASEPHAVTVRSGESTTVEIGLDPTEPAS